MTAPDQPNSNPISMKFGDLKKFVDERVKAAVDAVTGGGQDPAPRQRPFRDAPQGQPQRRSVDDEVNAAIKKLEADKEREKKETETDAKLAALEERTKERPPVERRRVHRLMGWGE
jgi:hypothetical protein